MKKIWFAIMATLSGLALVMSYRTSLGDAVALTPAVTGGGTGSAAPPAAPSPSAQSPATPTPSATGLVDGTFAGQAVHTRYGNVQAQITVAGGVITAVDVPQYPNSNARDQQINARAIPQLISETQGTSDANVDLVSGATYTSMGYEQSLQSALDQARA